MSKYEKNYQNLREEFSDEEIAAAHVFPDDLDQKEKEEIEGIEGKDRRTEDAFRIKENEIIDEGLFRKR